MIKLHLPIRKIGGHTHGDGWHTSGDALVNEDGDVLRALATNETHGGQVVATVLFNGIPVLLVFGSEDYRYYIPWYPDPSELKQSATFWTEVVTELGVAGRSPREAAEIIRAEIDDGMTVSVEDEFGGEGHDTVAFVGTIARALHEAFPDDTPELGNRF